MITLINRPPPPPPPLGLEALGVWEITSNEPPVCSLAPVARLLLQEAEGHQRPRSISSPGAEDDVRSRGSARAAGGVRAARGPLGVPRSNRSNMGTLGRLPSD